MIRHVGQMFSRWLDRLLDGLVDPGFSGLTKFERAKAAGMLVLIGPPIALVLVAKLLGLKNHWVSYTIMVWMAAMIGIFVAALIIRAISSSKERRED